MAVNLASKYSSIVAERFSRGSVTNIAFNTDYDWVGVDTVNVYSIDTMPMRNYVRSGMARYGTANEIEDTTQVLTLTQDRAFTGVVDRGNNQEQMYVKGAAVTLARQIDEVATPELDTYRIGSFVAAAGAAGNITTATPSANNAYSLFLSGQEHMGNNLVPDGGRIVFVSYQFYNFLKLDSSFVGAGNSAEISLVRGAVGMIDGVPIIPVPSNRLPANVHFILMHPSIAVSPITIQSLVIHENPLGINGVVLEGRFRYDSFVLDAKRDGIFVVQG